MKITHRFIFECLGSGLGGMDLLEEVCHWEWDLGFQMFKPGPWLSIFFLAVDRDVELSGSSPAPCLPVCHASDNDNGLSL